MNVCGFAPNVVRDRPLCRADAGNVIRLPLLSLAREGGRGDGSKIRAFTPAPFAALLLIPLLSGCPAPQTANDNSAPPLKIRDGRGDTGAFKQTDPWLLTTNDPNANRGNHGIFLGNGLAGDTVGADGGATKDSLYLVAGRYDASEVIKPQPQPSSHLPEVKAGEPYEQTLDMRHGVLITKVGTEKTTTFRSIGGRAGAMQSDDVNGPAAAREQEAAWAKLWQDADIQIDGDGEAQQLVHKLMFDLLQSTRPGASDSIAPESLSGDFYKGHIFWDAEIWMFPALLAQHPDYARSILDYRFKHLAEAKAKAKTEGYTGADFPWESASSGKEVAPSGFSKGRHVTAGVGWAHWQYWLATQDKTWLKTRGWPVLSAVADFWAARAKKNAQTGKWDVLDVYGPDENKGETDNNTYTNAMARYCLLAAGEAAKIVGQPVNPKWQTVANNFALPFDKKGGYYLARQNDDGKPTKQADGELVIYPAALPMDKKTAEATFDFQSKRPIRNGPAMTDAMHALIAARLGRAQEAEKAFRDSYRPFVRGPFLLFSEKRSLDRCVFTTGAGGVLQAVIYGFGGLDLSKPSGLIEGKPTLPASWKKLTITGIRRGGKRYTLTVTPEKRTLTAQS